MESNSRPDERDTTRRDASLVLAACVISARAHAALVPSHQSHQEKQELIRGLQATFGSEAGG